MNGFPIQCCTGGPRAIEGALAAPSSLGEHGEDEEPLDRPAPPASPPTLTDEDVEHLKAEARIELARMAARHGAPPRKSSWKVITPGEAEASDVLAAFALMPMQPGDPDESAQASEARRRELMRQTEEDDDGDRDR